MQDLTGKTFGRLTVIDHAGEADKWLCRCTCGKLVSLSAAYLLSGVKTSCGCKKGRAIDLSGQRFGHLVVIEPVQKRAADNSVRWLCKCDCGEFATVSSNKLRMGCSTSCGCQKMKPANAAKTFIDGTCADILWSEKLWANNTTGRRGVARKRTKWQAYITYAGVRHALGTFPTKEEAIAAREKAEHTVKERLNRLLAAGAG